MEPNTKSVIGSTTYQLLRQSVYEKPQILYAGSGDRFEVAGVVTEFRKFERKDLRPGSPMKVAVAYPTIKKEKTIPLKKAIKPYIDQEASEKNVEINIKELYFQVKNTGVGEQPSHPHGLVGALKRIYDIQDLLLGIRDWDQETFERPDLQEFDRIIIPSLESDIFDGDEAKYDKPNVIFYECITRALVAGMGTGPGVQNDIFELSKELGLVLFKDKKAVTYGKTLRALFPRLKINDANWHGVVCHPLPDGNRRDRPYFIEELCSFLGEQLRGFFDKVFDL